LIYLEKLYYICHLWPIWEKHLHYGAVHLATTTFVQWLCTQQIDLGEHQDPNMPNLALKTCIKVPGMALQGRLKGPEAPEMPFLPNFKPYKGLKKIVHMPP